MIIRHTECTSEIGKSGKESKKLCPVKDVKSVMTVYSRLERNLNEIGQFTISIDFLL